MSDHLFYFRHFPSDIYLINCESANKIGAMRELMRDAREQKVVLAQVANVGLKGLDAVQQPQSL